MNLKTKPASNYSLTDLLNLLNLSFEEYTVPLKFDFSSMLHKFREDDVDLDSSSVLLVDDGPAGIALIARRGWTGHLAAMGIVKAVREKKIGSWFMEKLIEQARERKDREMTLEVIEQNERAVRLYKRQGFQIVRRLIAMVKHEATDDQTDGQTGDLDEIDLRELGHIILQHGLPDLPWPLSGENIATFTPPKIAFKKGRAYAAISNPENPHIVILSLLVEPDARGRGAATDLLHNVMAQYPGKIWHVPAIFPEEMGGVFERAGFQREKLSQWQMCLEL